MSVLKLLLERFCEKKYFQLPLFGGVIFVIVFYWSYFNINDNYYQVRDDAVITMSHARNLIDYGFIGINPSGGRVEGFSAPVQFFIYAAIYALAEIEYDTYANAQTIIFTFLLGSIFILFFKEKKIYGLVLTLISAVVLSKHTAFLQWHGSGMENPVTHVLFLFTVLILYSFFKEERVVYPWSIIVFLATISRIDSVYHIAPLLIIFSFYWLYSFKSLQGFYFSLVVFVLWFLFNLWRYVYFGDVFPNTAYAQEIVISDRLRSLISWNRLYIEQCSKLSQRIFYYHGGYILFLIIPLLFYVRREKSVLLLFLLSGSLMLTAYLNPFLFGLTRLDPVRSTSQFAVFIMLSITSIFYFLENETRVKSLRRVFVYSLAIFFVVFRLTSVEPYDMCCRTQGFDSVRKKFKKLAEKEMLPRPTISNPDLGVMSWHKEFNIVDLGKLGTPIMAKLYNDRILSDYFFDYAAPDMIESHYHWTCRYWDSLFKDVRFRRMYRPVKERLTKGDGSCGGRELLSGIWIRKSILKNSKTPERKLIDALVENLSVERLHIELNNCQNKPENNCVYVARTAYRFLPEFRKTGQVDMLNELFSISRTKEYDYYLINSYKDGQAYLRAIKFISDR